MSYKIGSLFFDESIRIGQILWLAGLSDQPTQAFEDFLEDTEAKIIAKVFSLKLATAKEVLEDGPECFSSFLARENKLGFLVEVQTPVPTSLSGSGYNSHGFGYYTCEWFYTETLDMAFAERLVAWKEKFVARKKRELVKEAAKKAKLGNPKPEISEGGAT